MTLATHSSLCIVVASCDKYSDLWRPLFGEFFRHWPDCPYPIYLVANHARYPDPRVTTLLAGDDLDWSSTIAAALRQIDHTHLLFWIDDAFLAGKVPTQRVAAFWTQMQEMEANFLRLRPNPMPEQRRGPEIGILGKGAAYRVTLFATIWKTNTLREILRPGESAWAFELQGTERARSMDGFYSVLGQVFDYLHGVERGIWIRSTARALERRGYDLDYGRRGRMNRRESFGLQYRLFKSWVLHKMPERWRADSLRLARACYRILGAHRS